MANFDDNYGVSRMMKYATAKKPEVLADALDNDNYCIQLKKDGASYYWAKDLDGSVHLYKDSISKKTGEIIDKIENVPHMKVFAEQHFPNGSQVCVEVLWGETSKDVNRIMLASPEKAIGRQRDEVMKVYIFDVVYWNGEKIHEKDFSERWGLAQSLEYQWQNLNTEWLTFAETHYSDKSDHLSEWLAAGEEGGVLKMLHSTKKVSAAYHLRQLGATNARPMHTTFKVKQIDTVDVVVIGIEMPTKEYTGKNHDTYEYRDEDDNPVNKLWYLGCANSLVIGAYDENGELVKIGSVHSGLTELQLKEMANEPEKYLNTTIEVDCMSIDKKARTLRHPRFMRMRPDKEPNECLMKEIFA